MTDEYPHSPVPSDADLWPGELPFTAFGQWGEGHLDLRVFDQDVYWVDRFGAPHLLEEMDEAYRRNVIGHLTAHVEGFYAGTLRRATFQMLGDALLGRVSGEVVAGALGAPTLTELTPVEWLESTPLMRRLRRLTPEA